MEPRRIRYQRSYSKNSISRNLMRITTRVLFFAVIFMVCIVFLKGNTVEAPTTTKQPLISPAAPNAAPDPVKLAQYQKWMAAAQQQLQQQQAEERLKVEKERELQQKKEKEAAYYEDPARAATVMDASWSLLPNQVDPGDVLLVRHDQAASFEWQGKTYKLAPFGIGYFTYLPVSIQTKPGTYEIGGAKLTVRAKSFPTDRIKVSQQLESIKQNTTRIAADQKKIDKARSHSADHYLFSPGESFIQPVQGRISTPYGYTRYVNGKYDGSHHALDIAAPEGTPVKASNDGVVVLAEKLYLTGNSVYIDHGMDLFSQYIHMSELKVKSGDPVKKGQVIGLVGQTGFATGPHLHFTFWAHNIPVNPNLFFGTTPFEW